MVHKESFSLPFGLVATMAPLTKKAAIKLDFDIAPQPVKLAEIFPGVIQTPKTAIVSLIYKLQYLYRSYRLRKMRKVKCQNTIFTYTFYAWFYFYALAVNIKTRNLNHLLARYGSARGSPRSQHRLLRIGCGHHFDL